MINGVISLLYPIQVAGISLHAGETSAAYFSAQSKSDLLKITIFNSLANGIISGNGALNFFGDKQIQSHYHLMDGLLMFQYVFSILRSVILL